jgi:predicted ATPase
VQLTSFSVSNYRSIAGAHSVSVSDLTVLIGKNNEGKSNILRALDAAMALLRSHSHGEPKYRRQYYSHDYRWKRDFPIQLQSRKGSKETTFRLEFSLTPPEIEEFRKEIGVNLNGLLPLEVVIGQNEEPEFRVVKTGRGTKTLTQKSAGVAKFVAKRIYFNYIPAIRTDKETTELIREMLAHELRGLEENPAYVEALNKIAEIQKPALDAIAARVEAPLREFLPSIKSVSLEIAEDERRFSLRRSVSVVVDDGTPTSIEFKGDGVKSLAALGLLKNSSRASSGGASILAIEEPESHLHPGAIHQVNEIIRSLSGKTQVLVTTHNPLFVDRANVSANVIVSDGGAKPAKSIKAIRDVLGIKASDNLMHANFALVVEGAEDVIAMKAIISNKSQKLAAALKANVLVIEPIGGAGNLSYKLSLLRNSLCTTHVLLDHDQAGRDAFERAKSDGLCSLADTTFTICPGCQDSEFEDTISPDIYKDKIKSEFGVDINIPLFRGNEKWSSRIKKVFVAHGKPCTDSILAKVKNIVAQCIHDAPENALHMHKSSAISAAITALENTVKS